MNVRAALPLGLAFTAAAILSYQSLEALPQFPHSVPWPPFVSWLAVTAGTLAVFVWFWAIAWAVVQASRFHVVAQGFLYLCAFVVGSAAFLAPLLLAYSFLVLCRLAADCGAYAQGFLNVLETIGRHTSLLWSALLSLALAIVGPWARRRSSFGQERVNPAGSNANDA